MIHHELYAKGEYCHALISSKTHPNILFPVRALIYDVKMDEYNPQYLIKIVKFYDDINFIKRWMFWYKFPRTFDTNADTWFRFSRTKYNSIEEFESRIADGEDFQKYMVVVDSVMCTKTEYEMRELFNTVQTFLIEKDIKNIFELSTRTYYKTGQYYFKNRDEFMTSIRKMLKGKEPNRKNWLEDIVARPTFEDLNDLD